MKIAYFLLTIMYMLCLPLNAQTKEKCSEKEFQSKKQTYITQEAGLTAEEAKQFFPIYFELQNKKKAINRSVWTSAKKGKSPQTTESEYNTILNNFIMAEEQNTELDKEYLKKYQSILSNKKIYMILRAEIKFNRNMLKIIQDKK